MSPELRPWHAWNDPDGDGHNCADCPDVSMWKCDPVAHSWLPKNPYDLLTPEQKRAIYDNGVEYRRTMRRARQAARNIELP